MKWDEQLTKRGALYVPYQALPGEEYWRLIEGQWLDLETSAGRHHIFVDVLDSEEQRLVGVGVKFINGGISTMLTEAKPNDPAALGFPMYAAGYGYSVRVDGSSDMVSQLGLGTIEEPWVGHHTSYFFIFQRAIGEGSQPPPTEPTDPNRLLELKGYLDAARSVVDQMIREMGPQG